MLLRLANHCRRILAEQLGRVGLVEADGARRPAIGKGEPVEVVEQAGPGLRREAHDGERAQMRAAKPRFEAAGQVLVDQDGVEIHRRLGHAHALAPRRNAGMQVGQRLAVIEPSASGIKPSISASTRSVRSTKPASAARQSAPVVRAALIEPGLGARRIVGRRQPEQASGNSGSRNARLPPRTARAVRRRPSVKPDRENRLPDSGWRVALRLDEDRPA